MTAELEYIRNVDKKRRIAVSGFIRRHERRYNQNIPRAIRLCCSLFYGNKADPKLIEEFSRQAHILNQVDLSSDHHKQDNIESLCPYHDMLPIINAMENEQMFNQKIYVK